MRRLTPFLALLLALTIAPLAPAPRAQVASAAQAELRAVAQLTQLPNYPERETLNGTDNSTINAAERIDAAGTASWTRTISGTIGSSADIDYYHLSLLAPASVITITLSGPEADYDLVLGGGVDTSQTESVSDAFETGLEQITQVGGSINSIGGSINSIGGSINSIGGSINSIGGSINSIGGSINSIGGSINSISANANTASEAIGTPLWLPGEYYVVVTTSNGQFSKTQPYTLKVELESSGLGKPQPAPEVSAQLFAPFYAPSDAVTTLYIYHSGRMAQLYPGEASSAASISSQLLNLASSGPSVNGAPPEYGLLVNLAELAPISGTTTISDVYSLWDSPSNQANPLYANSIAGLIDNVVEAVIAGGDSGPDPKFSLGNNRSGVPFPNIRNVVLVGGDDIIPYYRLPDLTTIANEADYVAYLKSFDASGVIRANSPLGAALRYRMILTDSPYGSGRPYRFYGFPFFVPRLAVGRLVETPAQIQNFLNGYEFAAFSPADLLIDATAYGRPNPPLRRASVSGYDFLKDQAAAINQILRNTGLQANEINTLINETWGRAELAQQWFDGALDSDLPPGGAVGDNKLPQGADIDLSSVNAHFDHWQLLPANDPTGARGQTFPALRLLNPTYPVRGEPPPYYVGTLGYSVGCHSGYNVLRSALAPGLSNAAIYEADFAQAFNWHGGNWVGNTGYGYGTADGIDYSERLAVLYTQELVRDTRDVTGTARIGASIGEALVKAKQRYVRNAASLTAYDYKTVNIMTFYGLPFLRMIVTNPLAPPAEEPAPNRTTPHEVSAPLGPNSLGRLTRTITFTIDVDASDFKAVPRTGSTLYDLDPADFTVVDEFDLLDGSSTDFKQQVRTFSNNQVGVPTLPTFGYDIGATNNDGTERLKVIDVVFLSGIYSGTTGFDPQVTQVVTETETTTPVTGSGAEPTFEAGAGFWYPDKFFGHSSVGQGFDQRDQLTSFAAQFRADADGTQGLLRPYSQMVFRVIYDDPSETSAQANALDADTTAPTITSVSIGPAGGGGANVAQLTGQTAITVTVVGVDDDGPDPGLAQVTAVLLTGGKNWVPVQFTKTGAGVYVSATLNVKSAAARFIVRATDKAGNTTYYTAKGQFTPIAVISLPMVRR